ncbi:MAG: flagellar FliJ family protein [Candidatus Kapaibacterium sp.]
MKFRTDKVSQAKDSLNQAVKIRLEKEADIRNTEMMKSQLGTVTINKIKAGDLQIKNNHIAFLETEILKLEEEKKQILEIENLRRIKLTNAMKDEKVIEKLKEKQYSNYMEEQRCNENKFLDEVALQRVRKS